MDKILQSVAVPRDRLDIITMACFIIASKLSEKEIDIPTIPELVDYTNYSREVSEVLVQMEIYILNKLEWNLNYSTCSSFLGYFLSAGVLFSDDFVNGRKLGRSDVISFEKYIKFFGEVVMRDYYFQQYKPSEVACAILMVSRKTLNFSSIWRSEHEYLTGYSVGNIENIMNVIYDEYMKIVNSNKAEESPDNVQNI